MHLSAVVLLRDHLTKENHAELIREACGKTKREVQEMLVARFPKPDAPTTIRALPEEGASSRQTPLVPTETPTLAARSEERPASTEPLSPGRYKVELTVSAALMDKIVRATDLMRHRNPSGELAVVLERAIDLLIAELERERFGKTKRPRSGGDAKPTASASEPTASVEGTSSSQPRAANAKSARAGYIPHAVRREVYERDGGQCTFIDEAGRRCSSRAFLELDHRVAKALGGASDATNVRLLCRFHNARSAERTFGRAHIERAIHSRQRERTSAGARAGRRECGSRHPNDSTLPTSPTSRAPDGLESTARAPNAVPRELIETAARALKCMGFRDAETVRALRVVEAGLAESVSTSPSVETVIRRALGVLT